MSRVEHGPVLARIGRNTGWLLGGRGFSAIVSIGYLAIAARALGPTQFGMFALILAYGGMIAGFVEFKSWQAVIRFGSLQLAQRRPERLARLLGFTATLDLAGAILGVLIAALGVHIAGPLLDWSAAQRSYAAWFGVGLLLSTGTTANGLLRLRNRFDLLTYAEAVGPMARLIGAAIVWGVGAGLGWFLVVWAAAALAESASSWIAAFRSEGVQLSFGRRAIRRAMKENPKLLVFMFQTNLSSTIGSLPQQFGTLAVGAADGPAAAGAFRIAAKLAGAIAKPVETVTRAMYPELARLAAGEDRKTLRRVSFQISWISSILAVLIIGAVWFDGSLLLRLFSGRAFMFAKPLLLLLTVAAAIDICGIVLEPILTAHGRSGAVLSARVAGALSFFAVLGALLPILGSIGAAIAAVASSLVVRGTMAALTIRSLTQ